MIKIFVALMCCVVFLPAPLWAADTHVFEFDYDNQIEAPVLNVPAATAIPLETQEAIVIPPPPVEVETAEPAPVAAEEATLDLLFMPVEAADAPKPKKPEKVSPPAPAVKAPAPKLEIATAIEKAATQTKAAPVKATPKAQVKKERAQMSAALPVKVSPLRADDSFYRRDPRYRFWLIATRTWNLSIRNISRDIITPQRKVLDLKELSGIAGGRVELTDLKNFPETQKTQQGKK